jgi:hypothetical protein
MGNLSFIVPTKNVEDFNIDKVFELLTEQFKDLYFELDYDNKSIQVRKMKDINSNLITDLYFNQDCYILDYDEDIETLKTASEEAKENGYDRTEFYLDQIEGLRKLKELNPDLDNVIQTTYGYGWEMDLKHDIDFFLKDYFYAYLFDEGIHPEYMGPEYKRKTKPETKSKIKSFFNFFK